MKKLLLFTFLFLNWNFSFTNIGTQPTISIYEVEQEYQQDTVKDVYEDTEISLSMVLESIPEIVDQESRIKYQNNCKLMYKKYIEEGIEEQTVVLMVLDYLGSQMVDWYE